MNILVKYCNASWLVIIGYGIDVCGRLSYEFFCVAGAHFSSKLVHELLRAETRFGGYCGRWSTRECVVLVRYDS